MWSATSDAVLIASLRDLVHDNAETMFGSTEHVRRIDRLSLSRARHRKGNRYHKTLRIHYSSVEGPRTKRVWLKFVTHVHERYAIHVAAWDQTREAFDLFPRPYFCAEWSGAGIADGGFIAMELVDGPSLRNIFLGRAFARRQESVTPVFEAFGRGLRAFHDSSTPRATRPARELEDHARRLVTETTYLSDEERRSALEHIAAAGKLVANARRSLSLIPVHHDCSLRNVVARPSGFPCLLDLDSMRASPKIRWYDVAVFLINLESQAKYSPLVHERSVAAAWRAFWEGYAGAGIPDGLSREQANAVVFLIKVDYLFGGPWKPLFEVYRTPLSMRYVDRLKASVLTGEHLILSRDPVSTP